MVIRVRDNSSAGGLRKLTVDESVPAGSFHKWIPQVLDLVQRF